MIDSPYINPLGKVDTNSFPPKNGAPPEVPIVKVTPLPDHIYVPFLASLFFNKLYPPAEVNLAVILFEV